MMDMTKMKMMISRLLYTKPKQKVSRLQAGRRLSKMIFPLGTSMSRLFNDKWRRGTRSAGRGEAL
ncbi:hypothetical protein I309_03293 [Cryptococcus deuterogattii LA55]|nr:hypothetical protein I309_03293 [Cryptococcus deuterogattii LA55]KIR73162.1 hypothetical protein I310_02826 [Cryptococcus deuterogattii CA1014]KIR90061.1 hypothetical protein I304_05993 [Cryptococcus deuterogattii CBS 10090]